MRESPPPPSNFEGSEGSFEVISNHDIAEAKHSAAMDQIRHEMSRVRAMTENLEEAFKRIEALREQVVLLKPTQRGKGNLEIELYDAEDSLKYHKSGIEDINVTEEDINRYFLMPEKGKLLKELSEFQRVKAQWQRYMDRPFDFKRAAQPLDAGFNHWKSLSGTVSE